MFISDNRLQLCFANGELGLSARRIWEHLALRQVNPFRPITRWTRIRAEDYVDIIDGNTEFPPLTGVTLADLFAGRYRGLPPQRVDRLLKHLDAPGAKRWLRNVESRIRPSRQRLSFRNVPAPFLPQDFASPLGVRGLHCALLDWLQDRRSEKAPADQWLRRIRNLRGKGLRDEELRFSDLDIVLAQLRGHSLDGATITRLLGYRNLQLSVIPVLYRSGRHVRFTRVPGDTRVKRTKPKLKPRLDTCPQWRDPVLGYWIDVVAWSDLFKARGWLVFTCRGEVVTSPEYPSGLCDSVEAAMALADEHAERIMPKMSTQGMFTEFRLTGGEQYREWLVTLPQLRDNYRSCHYDFRNIVLHVRCDVRETDSGKRAVLLQEVQSDWTQSARRSAAGDGDVAEPPWSREWPALALKLMLLHAAHIGVDALAWTPGRIQAERWGRSVSKALIGLYDRLLPRELNRLLRPYGRRCESIDVYCPVNFAIEPGESGYILKSRHGNWLASAESWFEVQQLLPDGAHEKLTTMHGIRLDTKLQQAILRDGFYAWGTGIG